MVENPIEKSTINKVGFRVGETLKKTDSLASSKGVQAGANGINDKRYLTDWFRC